MYFVHKFRQIQYKVFIYEFIALLFFCIKFICLKKSALLGNFKFRSQDFSVTLNILYGTNFLPT